MIDLNKITPCIVRVADGRGFIVSAGENDRYIITAAHCLRRHPTPHLANSAGDLTYKNIIGPLARKRKTIWAELAVDNLVDDIAVFSAPDGQEFYDECARYEAFTAAAMTIGNPPEAAEPYKWNTMPGTAAWVLSLDGEWQSCTVHSTGRFLRVTGGKIEGGTSGSPIIGDNGAAIGLISTSLGEAHINPSLMDCLPPWLLRKLDMTYAEAA